LFRLAAFGNRGGKIAPAEVKQRIVTLFLQSHVRWQLIHRDREWQAAEVV
jgi:hypothetical protein